jgi:hypothetical protein
VTVVEILSLVNLALLSEGVSGCAEGDTDGNGVITIDEILNAVDSALNTCPALPTPSPTPSFGGCGDVCDGRECLVVLAGTIGTCSGEDADGCQCVPFSAGATPTVTPGEALPAPQSETSGDDGGM